ncbi:GMP synthase [glutamine-hydrolyzing] subunit B [Candidatus Gugararchaeum adminiculabundum]|nr:GMP synthase [glutamine-hydrolyzing] subunit B [Candidatus Gugararchaeum adminiculabundum]
MKKLGVKTGLKVRVVDENARYFSGLKVVTDPDKKMKIIVGLFIEIFEEIAKK